MLGRRSGLSACELGLGFGQKGGLGGHKSGGLGGKVRGRAWRMFDRERIEVGKENERSS